MRKKKFTGYYICLLALHLLLGMGAVAGGFGAVMDPSGESMGAWRRYAFQPYVSSGLGIVMMLWIVIQVIVLQSVVALHVATFLRGMAVTLAALILAWKQREPR